MVWLISLLAISLCRKECREISVELSASKEWMLDGAGQATHGCFSLSLPQSFVRDCVRETVDMVEQEGSVRADTRGEVVLLSCTPTSSRPADEVDLVAV